MTDILLSIILVFLNQQYIDSTVLPRIISNESFHIEEYRTIEFDCFTGEHLLAAWRIRLRHDDLYR